MTTTAPAGLVAAIETRFGRGPAQWRTVTGGDINQAFEVTLHDGTRVFAKYHPRPVAHMFSAEARGLTLLDQSTALARTAARPRETLVVPQVLHSFEQGLLLSWLDREAGSLGTSFGRGLARLHLQAPPDIPGRGAGGYGLGRDISATIATLPQSEVVHPNWVDFFVQERLLVQLELPGARRALGLDLRRRFDELLRRAHDLLPAHPRRSLVHGDLWGGNAMVTSQGPALFDPAVSIAHHEVDLAMMDLFGGFSGSVWSAYEELLPREAGYDERIAIYQLYPLLVHVNLFGASYVSGIRTRLTRFE